MAPGPVEEMSALDFDRSNKGASKQRRDQINAEIATMRDLLPLPESSRQRLSQLQIMSLTCVYVRKCNILHKLFRSKSQEKLPESTDFFQALSGFVLVTTRDGKLLYISENVTDYLGHSMVDMKTQGDSLYDIVDKRDHNTVQAQLLQGAPPHGALHGPKGVAGLDKDTLSEDVSFFCRMNMSRTLKRQSGFGDVKVMHVRGHFINVRTPEGEGGVAGGESHCVFMATCSPLITPDLKETLVQNNTMVFKTVHKLDMAFIEMTKNAEHHLGCTSEDLTGKSWYTVLHPEDIHQAKDKHMQLIHSNHEMGCMVTVRMLRTDGTSFWVNSVMQVRQSSLPQSDDAFIVCISQVIDENEAYQIKLQAHMFSVYPSRAHELWGGHLSSMATGGATHDHIQPAHVAPGPQWVQQDGTCAVPVPGYHHGSVNSNNGSSCNNGTMPVYQGNHRMLPYQQALGPQQVMMVGRQTQGVTTGQYSQQHVQPQVQPDQLKAMLKRKIQGPQQSQQAPECKPCKMPRLEAAYGDAGTWSDKRPAAMGYSGKVMGSMYLNGNVHHHGQKLPSSFQCPQNVQVMQVAQPNVFTFGTKSSASFNIKGTVQPLMNSDSSLALARSEQVVPDVNVPESFLTPDPSPISSPQPSLSMTATMDAMEHVTQGKKGSINILQALEKLAAMPHQMRTQGEAASQDSKVSPSSSQATVPASGQAIAQRKKGLPIFDAFDIDNFFDALEPPAGMSKESVRVGEVQVKEEEIKTEVSTANPIGSMDSIYQMTAIKCEALSPPSSVPSMSPVHRSAAQASPSHTNQQQQELVGLKSEFPLSASACMKAAGHHYNSVVPNFTAVPAFSASACTKMEKQTSPQHPASCSPASARQGQEESLDDLLSYFSDDGADLSPLHTTCSQLMTCESSLSPSSSFSSSSSDDLLDDDHFHKHQQQQQQQLISNPFSSSRTSSLIQAEPCLMIGRHRSEAEIRHQPDLEELSPPCLEESQSMMSPKQQQTLQKMARTASLQHQAGELSPNSSTSSLAGEDDLLDERAAFTVDLALGVFGMQGQAQGAEQRQEGPISIKDREVMGGIPDELDFILDSLVSADGSLEMIKHGQ